MPDFPIRKVAVLTEEIFHDGGPAAAAPRRRAAAVALVAMLSQVYARVRGLRI